MKKTVLVFALALSLGLVACPSIEPTKPPTPAQTPIGLLEVKIDLTTNEASAKIKSPKQTRAASVLPSVSFGFTRLGVGFHDNELAGVRTVYATFGVRNNTASPINNFTTWALDVPVPSGEAPTPTQFGTMFTVINNAAGAAITDGVQIRNIQPIHGVKPSYTGEVQINSDTSDLQIISPSERADVAGQLNAAYGINTAGVLGYGYVARNATNSGRAIGATNGAPGVANSCTSNVCQGYITFAFKVPFVIGSTRASRPWAFAFDFAAGNQTLASTTQSLEEQATGTIAAKTLPTGTVKMLAGSSKNFSALSVENLCQIPTANASGTFTNANLLPSSFNVGIGSIDDCYWSGGALSDNFGSPTNDKANGAIIDSSSRLVVVGSGSPSSDFIVRRFNSDGTKDTSFDTDGSANYNFGPGYSNAVANAVKVDINGAIDVVGTVTDTVNGDTEVGIMRLLDNGALDTSFSGDGLLVVDFGANTMDTGTALTVLGDTLYIGGTTGAVGSRDYLTFKVLNTGVLDVNFSGDGKQSVDRGFDEVLGGIAAANATEIYLAGTTDNAGTKDWFIAKLGVNGNLDPTFNTTGQLQISFPGSSVEEANAVTVDAAGRIVVAGSTGGSSGDFAIGRFLKTGLVDTTFSGDGFNSNDPYSSAGKLSAKSIILDNNGNIIIAGDLVNPLGSVLNDHDIACQRFLTVNGTASGNCGLTDVNGESDDYGNAVARDPLNGKIYVVGTIFNIIPNSDALITRFYFPR